MLSGCDTSICIFAPMTCNTPGTFIPPVPGPSYAIVSRKNQGKKHATCIASSNSNDLCPPRETPADVICNIPHTYLLAGCPKGFETRQCAGIPVKVLSCM